MADEHGEPSGFSIKKKVDESWKDNVEKEKETVEPGSDEASNFQPNFSSFITTLGVQAFIALGEFPSSPNGETPPPADLVQAKSLIDILEILSEKTKGNLTEDEANMLQEILYGLKMKFVEKSSKP